MPHAVDQAIDRDPLRAPFERLLDERLGGQALRGRLLDQGIDSRHRRGGHASFQARVGALSGERRGRENESYEELHGRTISSAFCRPAPKPSST